MKKFGYNGKLNKIWFVLFCVTDLFFMFVVWLVAPENFKSLIVMMILFTLLIVLIGYFVSGKMQSNQQKLFEMFLSDMDEQTEELLLASVDKSWHPIIRTASEQMREQILSTKNKQLEIKNYREFIEEWTHEIKTPLSLATLVLGNHKDEMSPYVYKRMEHVRYVINHDVEKILHYARLHSDHVDYKFDEIVLNEFLQECIEDFNAIIEEKSIELQLNVLPIQVISDKKVLAFIIAQLLSNAFKYAKPDKAIVNISTLKDSQGERKTHLIIRDNGNGAPKENIPFLFDKGFTGNHPDRQGATGMGLYFVKKYAKLLSIEVIINPLSMNGEGFEIELVFPNVV